MGIFTPRALELSVQRQGGQDSLPPWLTLLLLIRAPRAAYAAHAMYEAPQVASPGHFSTVSTFAAVLKLMQHARNSCGRRATRPALPLLRQTRFGVRRCAPSLGRLLGPPGDRTPSEARRGPFPFASLALCGGSPNGVTRGALRSRGTGALPLLSRRTRRRRRGWRRRRKRSRIITCCVDASPTWLSIASAATTRWLHDGS